MRSNVNWQRYVNMIYRLGPQLDSKMDRFQKGKAIEKSIARYSLGNLIERIDENGRDLVVKNPKMSIGELPHVFVESKFHKNSIQGKHGIKKKIGNNVRLKNGMGKGKSILPENYAPFLLLLDTNSAVLIGKDTLKDHVENTSDCILIKKSIDINDCEVLFGPNDYRPNINLVDFDTNELRNGINQLIMDFIDSTP